MAGGGFSVTAVGEGEQSSPPRAAGSSLRSSIGGVGRKRFRVCHKQIAERLPP